jgi:hypothetical protein
MARAHVATEIRQSKIPSRSAVRKSLGHWAVFLCIALSACVSRSVLEQPAVFKSVQEAVSCRVAPLSIARWEDYVDARWSVFLSRRNRARNGPDSLPIAPDGHGN